MHRIRKRTTGRTAKAVAFLDMLSLMASALIRCIVAAGTMAANEVTTATPLTTARNIAALEEETKVLASYCRDLDSAASSPTAQDIRSLRHLSSPALRSFCSCPCYAVSRALHRANRVVQKSGSNFVGNDFVATDTLIHWHDNRGWCVEALHDEVFDRLKLVQDFMPHPVFAHFTRQQNNSD